eukprot:7511656-Lingulodinium_polyedra.AAC.1
MLPNRRAHRPAHRRRAGQRLPSKDALRQESTRPPHLEQPTPTSLSAIACGMRCQGLGSGASPPHASRA